MQHIPIEELRRAATTPREKRSPQQVLRLAAWLSTHASGLAGLPPHALHALPKHFHGWELYPGQVVYTAGDAAENWFVVVEGSVQFIDTREPEEASDAIVNIVRTGACFGEEEILSTSRRAFTATAYDATLLLQLSSAHYKELLSDLHADAFDAKVAFLCSLSPLKPLKEEVVRRLAPCFQVAEVRKGELVVRQGERADSMYVIRSGTCAVLVDPHYKEPDSHSDTRLGSTDPKKTVQVVTLEAGAIIGDVTVLAKVHRRTASVQAVTDVITLKIRKSVFLRRLPQDQLEILRHLAALKLKLMEKKVAAGPVSKGLKHNILRGHNLRDLMHQQQRVKGSAEDQPEEYQQLIYVLRRYKRTAAPPTLPKGAPVTFAAQHQSGTDAKQHTGNRHPGALTREARRDQPDVGTAVGRALHASIAVKATSTDNLVPVARGGLQQRKTSTHSDWLGRSRSTVAEDGSAAVADAMLRTLDPALVMSHVPPGPTSWPAGPASVATSVAWRPVSARRCIAHGCHRPPAYLDHNLDALSGQHHTMDYHANPFVASVTLRTLAAPLLQASSQQLAGGTKAGQSTGDRGQNDGCSIGSRPGSPSLTSPAGGFLSKSGVWSSSGVLESVGVSSAGRQRSASGGRPAGQPQNWLSKQLALDFHTDGTLGQDCSTDSRATRLGGGQRPDELPGLEEALEVLSKPLMESRPAVTIKQQQHFRPTIPKALL